MDFNIEIHIRIIQLHRKKRLKKFINILNKFNDESKLFKSVFIYTETEFQKDEIKKLTGIELEIFFNNLSFSEKNILQIMKYLLEYLESLDMTKAFIKSLN